MNLEIVQTADGSHSLFNASLNEHYHSTHGAIQESKHVFIKSGLKFLLQQKTESSSPPIIKIFEVGLGTGLNAFLTFLETINTNIIIEYTAIEAFPITMELAGKLNYLQLLNEEKNKALFEKIHSCEWESKHAFSPNFTFRKLKSSLPEIELTEKYDLLYFDAFAPEKQPEMWTEEIFSKLLATINPNGCMVTYCAKGVIKRSLKKVGFTVDSIPGPPGKREMVRAFLV